MSGACSAQGRQAGVGLGPPTRPGAARSGGWLPAGCRHPRVPVLARVAERLVAAATVAVPTDQASMARTIIDRDRTCWPPSTPRSPRPTSAWPLCCRGPGSRCCPAAWLAVVRAATAGAAVGDPARWPAPARWTEPAGCAPPPMPRPAAAMTAPSAGKARSPRGGPCAGSGRAVAAGPGRPRRCRLPAGPSQATRGDRQRHGESGQPDRLGHGRDQRPTTPPGGAAPALPLPVRGCQAGGWEPEQTPPAIWRTTGHAEARLVPGLRSPSSTRTRSADPLPREVAESGLGLPTRPGV